MRDDVTRNVFLGGKWLPQSKMKIILRVAKAVIGFENLNKLKQTSLF